MDPGAPPGMFVKMRRQLQQLEDMDRQIFEAETELELVQKARREKEARMSAIEEEHRVVKIALQASNATKANLQETLVQRNRTVKILEREVFRSEQELERIVAKAEADAKRASDAAEEFNRKHEEAVTHVWSKFPGFDELNAELKSLLELQEKIDSLKALTSQRTEAAKAREQKVAAIEAKKAELEALNKQNEDLRRRKDALEARSAELRLLKEAKRRQEAEAAAAIAAERQAAEEQALKDEAKRREEAAERQADEERTRRDGEEFNRDIYGRQVDADTSYDQEDETVQVEDRSGDRTANWTLPIGTQDFGACPTPTRPIKSTIGLLKKFDFLPLRPNLQSAETSEFSCSLAESTPSVSGDTRLIPIRPRMTLPHITPISSFVFPVAPSSVSSCERHSPEKDGNQPGGKSRMTGQEFDFRNQLFASPPPRNDPAPFNHRVTQESVSAPSRKLHDMLSKADKRQTFNDGFGSKKRTNDDGYDAMPPPPPPPPARRSGHSLSTPTPPKVMRLGGSGLNFFSSSEGNQSFDDDDDDVDIGADSSACCGNFFMDTSDKDDNEGWSGGTFWN